MQRAVQLVCGKPPNTARTLQPPSSSKLTVQVPPDAICAETKKQTRVAARLPPARCDELSCDKLVEVTGTAVSRTFVELADAPVAPVAPVAPWRPVIPIGPDAPLAPLA